LHLHLAGGRFISAGDGGSRYLAAGVGD